ncbi:MAG: hypothetical protein ACOCXX_01765, partial [Planctomycetota bacterium]
MKRFVLAIVLCAFALAPLHAATYTETFDGLANGTIDGQNGWSLNHSGFHATNGISIIDAPQPGTV